MDKCRRLRSLAVFRPNLGIFGVGWRERTVAWEKVAQIGVFAKFLVGGLVNMDDFVQLCSRVVALGGGLERGFGLFVL